MDQALCSALWAPRGDSPEVCSQGASSPGERQPWAQTAKYILGYMLGITMAGGKQLIPAQRSGSMQARPGQRRLGRISGGTLLGTGINKVKGREFLSSQEAAKHGKQWKLC